MGGHWGDGSRDCLRYYPERDSGGDSGHDLPGDVRGLLLRDVQDDSGVNSARGLGANPEFDLPRNPYRHPGRNLQDYPQGYLQDHLQGYLQDDLPGSLPDCGPISARRSLGQHFVRSGAGGQGREAPARCRG